MKIFCSTIILAFSIAFLTISANAQETLIFSVEDYSPNSQKEKETDIEWDLLKMKSKNLTEYTLINDGRGNKVIKGVADRSASGLIYEVDINPKEYPIIEWRWKVDDVLPKGDLREKDGDDYPARIYITFDYNKSKLNFGNRIKYAALKTFTSYRIPLRSINYIWANKAEKGTFAPNPFTDWVQMVAVQSGNEKAGMWISESRNIYEDYKKAFGEEPSRINGIAIMTDADNTKDKAVGYYGDIIFKKNSSSSVE